MAVCTSSVQSDTIPAELTCSYGDDPVRQGDPGSSRFFISLDDKLMRLFAGDFVKRVMQWAGLEDGEPIISPMVTRKVEGAQKRLKNATSTSARICLSTTK